MRQNSKFCIANEKPKGVNFYAIISVSDIIKKYCYTLIQEVYAETIHVEKNQQYLSYFLFVP